MGGEGEDAGVCVWCVACTRPAVRLPLLASDCVVRWPPSSPLVRVCPPLRYRRPDCCDFGLRAGHGGPPALSSESRSASCLGPTGEAVWGSDWGCGRRRRPGWGQLAVRPALRPATQECTPQPLPVTAPRTLRRADKIKGRYFAVRESHAESGVGAPPPPGCAAAASHPRPTCRCGCAEGARRAWAPAAAPRGPGTAETGVRAAGRGSGRCRGPVAVSEELVSQPSGASRPHGDMASCVCGRWRRACGEVSCWGQERGPGVAPGAAARTSAPARQQRAQSSGYGASLRAV